MDRKGKQKLKRYFIVYVIFAVFFTVGMYLITKYEENAKATQIALLLAEHPELEGEIVAIWEKSGTVDFIRDRDDQKIERVVQMLEETYGYHSGSGSSDVVIRIIWGIGLLVGVIVCSLFLYLDRRKNWSRYGDEEQLQQLYECLQEFRIGTMVKGVGICKGAGAIFRRFEGTSGAGRKWYEESDYRYFPSVEDSACITPDES